MKPNIVLVLAALLMATTAQAAEEPVRLAPYKVEERPFGFLGIRHATIAMNPWKLIVGMNSLRFLQIDELDPLSPGVAAGVLPGDQIVSIDGVPLAKIGVRKLRRMGSEVVAGQKMTLEIFRPSDGSKRAVEVVVPKKPTPTTPSAPSAPSA